MLEIILTYLMVFSCLFVFKEMFCFGKALLTDGNYKITEKRLLSLELTISYIITFLICS